MFFVFMFSVLFTGETGTNIPWFGNVGVLEYIGEWEHILVEVCMLQR